MFKNIFSGIKLNLGYVIKSNYILIKSYKICINAKKGVKYKTVNKKHF